MDESGPHLVQASATWRAQVLPMAREFIDAGEPAGRGADPPWALAIEDFSAYITATEAARVAPGDGFVAMTTYWLGASDGRLLGQSRLRHELNDALRIEGGHIGYMIRPGERRRGYGTLILALTLGIARERGFEGVLITCDDDNEASWKIIERNGGRLQGLTPSPRSGKPVRRYRIEPRADS